MSEASKAVIHRWPKRKMIKQFVGKADVFKEEFHGVSKWKGYFIRVEVPARFKDKKVKVKIWV